MAEQPLTFETLVRFHREVMLPDVERIIDVRIGVSIGALRHEMLSNFDAVNDEFFKAQDLVDELRPVRNECGRGRGVAPGTGVRGLDDVASTSGRTSCLLRATEGSSVP